ncbi:extracellular catalytic domain type 2 short-chain-length polyhydroxyalkanoate depolymerase [Thermomonospora cellulosilytica]|nr:PHB depolymerase family esterase [Thermomonospora cellulosilytica]
MMRLRLSALTAAIATAVTGVLATAALAAVPPPTAGDLRSYNIGATYVSGVSSGGYMANQLHVAYSGVFQGAGIFSAGPYRCAQGDLATALNACMQTYMPRKTPAQLVSETRSLASSGAVDPVANLSGDPVYLYHGSNDQTVVRAVNDDLAAYYQSLGARVSYRKTTSGHAWVSPIGPVSCTSTASPFINNCGDDPPGQMLAHLFGAPVNAPASQLNGTLIQFDQNDYAVGGDASAISMGDEGFAYVPDDCANGAQCRLMVALHGCKQGYRYQSFGDKFMRYAYLNEYADTNDMIVLYPQAIPTTDLTNPNGCWNWWAYQGDTRYAQHGGTQIETILNMVEALTGSAPPPSPTPTPTLECVTASNYAHTTAGRAYALYGNTYANGSNEYLGLWNIYTTSSIRQTSPGHWVKC